MINTITYIKHFTQCLAHSKNSVSYYNYILKELKILPKQSFITPGLSTDPALLGDPSILLSPSPPALIQMSYFSFAIYSFVHSFIGSSNTYWGVHC